MSLTVIYADEYDGEGDNQHYFLYNFENENQAGYGIWNDYNKCVEEISLNKNPYDNFLEKNYGSSNIENKKIYYNGSYIIEVDNIQYEFDFNGNVYNIVEKTKTISNYARINSEYEPKLQYSSNCIVAAMANIIWYYGENGIPSLIQNQDFEITKENISNLFDNGYRNNDVPYVFSLYVAVFASNYMVDSSTKWNPDKSDLRYEIDNNYPCMVGFKAGQSSYSETVGHMTACFGYTVIPGSGESILMKLADGHSSKYVYKTWSSVNNCIITMHMNKYK